MTVNELMDAALFQAELAKNEGETPVGAVIARNGEIIAAAHNRVIALNDPTAHAETLAIREAARLTGDFRLTGCTLYSTVAPCEMCMGAVKNARIRRVVYGAEKAAEPLSPAVLPGVRKNECTALMREVFQAKRVKKTAMENDTMERVRTRFAPSPTGYLHIGGLRSALYAWLFARKNGGDFILRIEDTDQERFVEGATDVIYSTLREAGLNWDEGPDVGGDYGPYIQTERREIYKKYAEELVAKGAAYYCFCTKDELDERRKAVEAKGETFKYDKHCMKLSPDEIKARIGRGDSYVIRQNVPTEGETAFEDMVFGTVVTPNETLDDNVLIKADGLPTYNFANVIDDHLMQISHVMRGTEYLSSTPKYNLLYEAFGWEIPKYIHMTPVMRDAQHKLSKRDGDASYDDFIKKGFLTDAIVNYIALLGWNPGTNQELFSLDELTQAFSVEGMSKSPSVFDVAKLTWMNGEYIRRLEPEVFNDLAQPWYDKAGVGAMDIEILRDILQPRLEIFSQIPELTRFLIEYNDSFDLSLYANKKCKADLDSGRAVINDALPILGRCKWRQTAIREAIGEYIAEKGMKNGTALWPLRIALSGQLVTPGGAYEIAALLGKEETLRRLTLALERI